MRPPNQTTQCAICGGRLASTGGLAGQCPQCLLKVGLGAGAGNLASLRDVPPESLPLVGSQIGPYHIEGLLGAGGMGQVYRAMDTRLGRKVAIKFLSANVADAAGRRRFQREAQMASSLNHPHILTVYDAGDSTW
jgi:serine/threonine protein kinase